MINLEFLNIDKKYVLDKFVSKAQIKDSNELTTQEFNMFSKKVKKVHVHSVINKDTIKLREYVTEDISYREIVIVRTTLSDKSYLKKAHNIIHKLFNSPVLSFVTYDDEVSISIVHKRLNKIEKNKVVLDNLINTDLISDINYIKLFDLNNIKSNNLYELYESLEERIIIESVLNDEISDYTVYLNQKDKLINIKQKEEELKELKDKYKKEDMINEQLSLNMKIKKLEKELEQLKGKMT